MVWSRHRWYVWFMTHGRNIQIQSCLGVLDKIKDDKSMYVYQFQARDVHQDLEKWKVARGDPGCQRQKGTTSYFSFFQMLPDHISALLKAGRISLSPRKRSWKTAADACWTWVRIPVCWVFFSWNLTGALAVPLPYQRNTLGTTWSNLRFFILWHPTSHKPIQTYSSQTSK